MVIQPRSVQLSVAPHAQTQEEIENTIDAPRNLAKAIETLKQHRADVYGSSPPKQKEKSLRQNPQLFGKVAAQGRYAE